MFLFIACCYAPDPVICEYCCEFWSFKAPTNSTVSTNMATFGRSQRYGLAFSRSFVARLSEGCMS